MHDNVVQTNTTEIITTTTTITICQYYERALCFYFEDGPEICKIKSKNGRIIDKTIKKYGCYKDKLLFDEIWHDIVLSQTVEIYEKYEINDERYIMKSVCRGIRHYLLNKIEEDKEYEYVEKIEERINNFNYSRYPLYGRVCPTLPEYLLYLAGGEGTDILRNFLKKEINELYYKIFELFYIENLSDREIAKSISLKYYSICDIRQKIIKYLIDNKKRLYECLLQHYPLNGEKERIEEIIELI